MIVFLLMLLAAPSWAYRDIPFAKKAHTDQLKKHLEANGFVVERVMCDDDPCSNGVVRLSDSEAKDPSTAIAAYSWSDPMLPIKDRRAALRQELSGILAKADADVTTDDLKRAIRIMAEIEVGLR